MTIDIYRRYVRYKGFQSSNTMVMRDTRVGREFLARIAKNSLTPSIMNIIVPYFSSIILFQN